MLLYANTSFFEKISSLEKRRVFNAEFPTINDLEVENKEEDIKEFNSVELKSDSFYKELEGLNNGNKNKIDETEKQEIIQKVNEKIQAIADKSSFAASNQLRQTLAIVETFEEAYDTQIDGEEIDNMRTNFKAKQEENLKKLEKTVDSLSAKFTLSINDTTSYEYKAKKNVLLEKIDVADVEAKQKLKAEFGKYIDAKANFDTTNNKGQQNTQMKKGRNAINAIKAIIKDLPTSDTTAIKSLYNDMVLTGTYNEAEMRKSEKENFFREKVKYKLSDFKGKSFDDAEAKIKQNISDAKSLKLDMDDINDDTPDERVQEMMKDGVFKDFWVTSEKRTLKDIYKDIQEMNGEGEEKKTKLEKKEPAKSTLSEYFEKKGKALLKNKELTKKVGYEKNEKRNVEENVKALQTAMNKYANKQSEKLNLGGPGENGNIIVDGKAGGETDIAVKIINEEEVPEYIRKAKYESLGSEKYRFTGEGTEQISANAKNLAETFRKKPSLLTSLNSGITTKNEQLKVDDFDKTGDDKENPGIKKNGSLGVWKFQKIFNESAKTNGWEKAVAKRGEKGKLTTDGLLGKNTNSALKHFFKIEKSK